jgi:hypothetical protein
MAQDVLQRLSSRTPDRHGVCPKDCTLGDRLILFEVEQMGFYPSCFLNNSTRTCFNVAYICKKQLVENVVV